MSSYESVEVVNRKLPKEEQTHIYTVFFETGENGHKKVVRVTKADDEFVTLHNTKASYFHERFVELLEDKGSSLNHEAAEMHMFHLVDQISSDALSQEVINHRDAALEDASKWNADNYQFNTNNNQLAEFDTYYTSMKVPPGYSYDVGENNIVNEIVDLKTGRKIKGMDAVMLANQYTQQADKLDFNEAETDKNIAELFDRIKNGEVFGAELTNGVKPPQYLIDVKNGIDIDAPNYQSEQKNKATFKA